MSAPLESFRRRPDSRTAMRQLIAEVRVAIPFQDQGLGVCTGECGRFPVKLLEFLAAELAAWERRLDAGAVPGLADLSQLARASREVHRALGLGDAA